MRRFNYTGRRRIERDDVLVTLHPQEDGALEFNAIVDVSGMARNARIPGTAQVFLEAYDRTKFERFDLGTIDSPEAERRYRLGTFGGNENVRFRVKVVDTDGMVGRIVGLADRIRPRSPSESHQSSLLPVDVSELDDLVYKVDFPEDGAPTLVLNKSLDRVTDQGIKAYVRSPEFISLVLPDVVRQILTRILIIDGNASDEDDGSSWTAKWKRFAASLNTEEMPELEDTEDPEPLLEWIEDVVRRVGRKLDAVRKFEQEVLRQP